MISGANIIGGNPKGERIAKDFYTTNPAAVRQLIDKHYGGRIKGDYLEPCVATGNIAEVLKSAGANSVDCVDITDYGYPTTQVADFLQWQPGKEYDGIITNPPFSLAEEFLRKCMTCVKPGGEVAMFLKIQFLEGQKRRELFKELPPKYVYVFSERICAWPNNEPRNPTNGKAWATTMCMAWYVWQRGFQGEPTVRWL